MHFWNCPFLLTLLAVLGAGLNIYQRHRAGVNASTWRKAMTWAWLGLLTFDVAHYWLHLF